jgi:hypothetical protein
VNGTIRTRTEQALAVLVEGRPPESRFYRPIKTMFGSAASLVRVCCEFLSVGLRCCRSFTKEVCSGGPALAMLLEAVFVLSVERSAGTVRIRVGKRGMLSSSSDAAQVSLQRQEVASATD